MSLLSCLVSWCAGVIWYLYLYLRRCAEVIWYLYLYLRWCAEVIWYCKRCSAKSEDSQEGREELVGGSRLSLISSHHFHTWLFPIKAGFSIDIQQD